MYQPLDGPAVYGNISVTTSAAELKVGGSTYEDRKVLSIQPIDGDIFVGYDSSVTTSNGIKIFQGQYVELERGELLPVYAIAASTVDVRISEIG